MPPTRKFGFLPAVSKSQASIAVVVVLPCVPLTTMECLPGRNSYSRISGRERCGSLRSSISSTSAFPREMALPTTTRSGAGVRLAGSNAVEQEMPRAWRKLEAGGYTPASEPVTLCPRSRSMAASGDIAEPQMPIMWMCFMANPDLDLDLDASLLFHDGGFQNLQ